MGGRGGCGGGGGGGRGVEEQKLLPRFIQKKNVVAMQWSSPYGRFGIQQDPKT